jgi:nitroimidazol reductase NimA-like FMN-containing flavoprotein (pyridoxamine 5'-phosphate oxidase superfamily)
MRRPIFHMTTEAARAFVAQATVVHLASTDGEGRPILRTVHGILDGDAIAFHGSPVGEKQETVGRQAVIGAEEIVASIPSYFFDAQRACPATTYYRSVQIHGVVEPVADPDRKARILQALMRQFQPEGGHVPITADHPLYSKAVAGIQVLQVPFSTIDGKAKLGQNLKPEQLGDVVTRLWQRGEPGDPRAIDLIREANPAMAVPAFLQGPDGMIVRCHVGRQAVKAFLAVCPGGSGVVRAVQDALAVPTAVWVGAQDGSGNLTACLAAASDGRQVRILAEAGEPSVDREGLLGRLRDLILDHPALRSGGGRQAPVVGGRQAVGQ